MKLAFGVLCLIAAASAVDVNIIYPDALFSEAQKYQNNINVMQTDMFKLITDLRLELSATLKKTANSSLAYIEADIRKVFEIDEPYRTLLFVTNDGNSTCVRNMRNRLNSITEFTGFKAGICLHTYDRGVNKVVNETFSQVAVYDDELSAFELSVIKAFAGKNVWTQPDKIKDEFIGSYDKFKVIYDDFKAKIDGFSSNIEEKVKVLAETLVSCYKVSQDEIVSQLTVLGVEIETCITFDNLD